LLIVADASPSEDILPYVGLKPKHPVKQAGILILLAMSVPIAIGTHLEETKPASPPLLPPHDLVLS